MHARYQGAPAVIKLFGPGNGRTFDREKQAYLRLQHHQGTLLPRMLGSGYIAPGVLFIALSGELGHEAQSGTRQLHRVCCMQHQQHNTVTCKIDLILVVKQPGCCACTHKLASGWLQAAAAAAAAAGPLHADMS